MDRVDEREERLSERDVAKRQQRFAGTIRPAQIVHARRPFEFLGGAGQPLAPIPRQRHTSGHPGDRRTREQGAGRGHELPCLVGSVARGGGRRHSHRLPRQCHDRERGVEIGSTLTALNRLDTPTLGAGQVNTVALAFPVDARIAWRRPSGHASHAAGLPALARWQMRRQRRPVPVRQRAAQVAVVEWQRKERAHQRLGRARLERAGPRHARHHRERPLQLRQRPEPIGGAGSGKPRLAQSRGVDVGSADAHPLESEQQHPPRRHVVQHRGCRFELGAGHGAEDPLPERQLVETVAACVHVTGGRAQRPCRVDAGVRGRGRLAWASRQWLGVEHGPPESAVGRRRRRTAWCRAEAQKQQGQIVQRAPERQFLDVPLPKRCARLSQQRLEPPGAK